MYQSIIRGFGVLLVVIPLVLPGCDFGGQEGIQDQIRERVEARRQQWEDQDIENYKLVYSQQVGDVLIDTVNVFVSAGAVDSITTSSDVSKDELLVGTVGTFFDLIEARIGESESQFSAGFNNERGYPVEYTADFRDGRPSQTVVTTALNDSLEVSD
jgi:hypothetical protein